MTFNDRFVRNVVRRLLTDKDHYKGVYSSDDILCEILKYQKSTIRQAEKAFNEMLDMGLGVCKESQYFYSIPQFAKIRGYISKEDAQLYSQGKKK